LQAWCEQRHASRESAFFSTACLSGVHFLFLPVGPLNYVATLKAKEQIAGDEGADGDVEDSGGEDLSAPYVDPDEVGCGDLGLGLGLGLGGDSPAGQPLVRLRLRVSTVGEANPTHRDMR
jgi:hypothetical protein